MILSVPSYVIPGTYLENVRLIAGIEPVQSVELLFYFFDEDTRELFRREREGIKAYRDRLAFTVHLPDPLLPKHREVVELTRDLAAHYVVHAPASDPEGFHRLLSGWSREFGVVFLLENLIDRDFDTSGDHSSGLPVCCDTGHLLMQGQSVLGFIRRYEARLREIHLHGVSGGKDHQAIAPGQPWFEELVPYLRDFRGVVNLEVFALDQVRTLIDRLSECGLIP